MGIGTQRQVHGFPQSHPARPDELAHLVIALCLGGRHDGVSLHLHQQRFGVRRDQPRVRVRHGSPGLLATLHPVGCPLEGQAGVFHAPHQGGDEDRLLVREEPEEIRLGDTDTLGIASVEVPSVALTRELDDRRTDDALAPLLRTDPGPTVILTGASRFASGSKASDGARTSRGPPLFR
ncbi:hypothetical protein [Streptomyces mirabilis]|uniref:hypothetical protein n=1 Tax=Streptomyces mirabilis TaxID=68239 RepID=UPI0033E983B4